MFKYRVFIINFIGLFTLNLMCYSQIGINTDNPKALLHIDGAKNNPSTGMVSSSLLLDDVIVDNDGNVGLGAIPTVKLEITGSLYLGDSGLQPEMRLISDANGYATWKSIDNLLNPIEKVEKGLLYGDPTGLTDPNVADPSRTYSWWSGPINRWMNVTRTAINVTPGTWLIYASVGITTVRNVSTTGNNFAWIQLRNKTNGTVLDTSGNLYEFTGGGWGKPQLMTLIVFNQNAELEIWIGNEGPGEINNRYGGSHFGAIKIL